MADFNDAVEEVRVVLADETLLRLTSYGEIENALGSLGAMVTAHADVVVERDAAVAELREIGGWIGVPPGMMKATVSERVRHTLNALQVSRNKAQQQIIALEANDE